MSTEVESRLENMDDEAGSKPRPERCASIQHQHHYISLYLNCSSSRFQSLSSIIAIMELLKTIAAAACFLATAVVAQESYLPETGVRSLWVCQISLKASAMYQYREKTSLQS